MAHGNLLQWANSIRSNMADDSGREFFQQQVQTQGFLFLDNYLDNILSGTKQDPLIDLVKTPGRRKAAAKKPKLASKLGNPISFSLVPFGRENELPPNTTPAHITPQEPESKNSTQLPNPIDVRPLDSCATLSQKQNPVTFSSLPETEALAPVNEYLSPTPAEQANLSVIAEDEEPAERSRMSIKPSYPLPISLPKQPSPQPSYHPPEHYPVPVPPPPELTRTESPKEGGNDSDDVAGQDISFHSIPINSPSDYHSAQGTPLSPGFPVNVPALSEKHSTKMLAVDSEQPHGAQLDRISRFSQDITDVVDLQVPLRDAESGNKTTSMTIPSLPEPMQLRKSIRALRDPSVGTALIGGATPGNAAGKRTSWLMKAREVKALDMTLKKSAVAFLPPPTTGGTISKGFKRKSDDIEPSTVLPYEQERKAKVAKHDEGHTPSSNVSEPSKESIPHTEVITEPQTSPGVLTRLKKTVEGLVGKTMAKNATEGSVVSVIAEARAAAEARIAERNQEEPSQTKMDIDPSVFTHPPSMTITDLFPPEGHMKEKHKVPEKTLQFSPSHGKRFENTSNRDSTSTTPPHSPPAPSSSFIAPTVPVFNKPTPVFVPPASLLTARPLPSPPATKGHAFQAPLKSMYPSTLGLSLFGSQKARVPLTAQSTMESLRSELMFDDPDDVPAWMPTTQDTDYTTGFETQPDQHMSVCDEDDSWPVDEKLAAGVQWTFGGGMSKEDSMTWSTLPSQSQRGGDTGPFATEKTSSSLRNAAAVEEENDKVPGAFDFNVEGDDKQENDLGEEIMSEDKKLEDIILGDTDQAVPVESKPFRPQSQMSMASSSSSQPQSQGGFLNQASKLFSTALGATKKKQPEVKKVLSKAAAAAKKQQEEADRKAVRIKDMEIRRQQANQRKAEEEKAKQLEEERRKKEDAERRKRERDEAEKQRSIKPTPVRKEEEKKRPEADKKPELKKTASIPNLNKSQLKPALKSSTKNTAFGGSSQPTAGPSGKPTDLSRLPKFAPSSSLKGKAKVQPMTEDELGQPSQLLHDQMAARAKAQIQASKQTEPLVPSESIELPDINSEYSDSEDEDRPRAYDPPNWAQSPELREALKLQSTINPDDIFGAVRPLRMEEIFRTRTSRFRARTSSANWTGTDRLTVAEEKDYATRMGFK